MASWGAPCIETEPLLAADTVVSPMSHDSPPVRRLADWDHERLEAVAAEHGTPLRDTSTTV